MNSAARQSKPNGRRVWAINGDFVTLKPNGVARYAREVTLALDALLAAGHPLTWNLDLTLLAPRDPGSLALRHIPVNVIPEYRRPRLPQVWTQLQLPFQVKGGLLSFCNLAPVSVSRQIVCIHDGHTFVQPESYSLPFRMMHRCILPVLGYRVRFVTTVSEFSASHLEQLGIAPRRKLVVAYNGSDHALRWNASASTRNYADRKPYVLCIGRDQPYKNMALIWKIAPELQRLGLDVVVVGDLVAPPRLGKNVHFVGRVDDDELAAAISAAVCFLFPSRIEGFGLPAAEAMALGCVVIASTAPAIREVCGDAARYADPDDAQGWVDAITELVREADHLAVARRKARERAERFSWQRVAETYLALMARVDGSEDVIASTKPRSAD